MFPRKACSSFSDRSSLGDVISNRSL
jgi:hypothetical protein